MKIATVVVLGLLILMGVGLATQRITTASPVPLNTELTAAPKKEAPAMTVPTAKNTAGVVLLGAEGGRVSSLIFVSTAGKVLVVDVDACASNSDCKALAKLLVSQGLYEQVPVSVPPCKEESQDGSKSL